MSNTNNQQKISFGDAVTFQGRTAIVVSAGARMGAKESRESGGKVSSIPTLVLDLAVFTPITDGAGKPRSVVGTAEQSKLVGFVHDIPLDQVEQAEDWFFSLSDEEAAALDKERQRRQHEKAQAQQAAQDEAEKAEALDGVQIRPSKRVLEVAEKLWKEHIRAEEHADEHEDVILPAYDAKPEAWKPWIEKAKLIPVEIQPEQAPAGEAKPEIKGGDEGPVN